MCEEGGTEGMGHGARGHTDECETAVEFVSERVNTIILNALDDADILITPGSDVGSRPCSGLANTEELPDTHSTEEIGVIRVPQVAEVHIIEDATREGAVHE